MSRFSLLWGKILESSIWIKESKETRLVWITMLAMKDEDGIIESSLIGLADRAKVTVGECKEALRIFFAPDPDDSSKVEQGRRIREVPGGWQIINNDLYRFSTEERREMWRQAKAKQREKDLAKPSRKKPKPSLPLPGERAYCEAAEDGATAGELDRIVTGHLPDGG